MQRQSLQGAGISAAMLASLLGFCACTGGTSDPAPATVPEQGGARDQSGARGRGGAAGEVGARIFAQNCVPCHREDGEGIPSVFPSLIHSPVVNGDPGALAQWVLRGKRPPSMPEGRYSTQMLAFGWLKDADAAALLTYVRSHFGNSAPPVDAATIARER